MLLDSERARHAVGEVAVPYGTCTEPTNVKAGGGACPVRFRCAGCDHFRTTIAYLPELQAHLDDLLRTRERLAAAIDGVDDWARADATPTQEEITRIRRLINRIKSDVADLDEGERARIDEAVAIVRRHRAAHTSRSACRHSPPHPPGGRRMTRPTTKPARPQHTASPADARRPPRRLDAPPPTRPGDARPGSRRRGPDQRVRNRSCRRSRPHIPLPSPRPAGENPCTASRSSHHVNTDPAVTRASLQADLLAAHERAARLNARIQQLEKRLSEALGEQTWRESGLGGPTDIDALHQRISQLEQHNLDLQQQLEERDDDLTAARATNRELMARLNTTSRITMTHRESACTTPVAADSIPIISL